MKRRQVLFWLVAIAAAALLSIPLAGAVEDGFIQPVIRFFWMLQGYYGSVHQAILWGVALIGVAVIAGMSLRVGTLHLRARRGSIEKLPGEVGQLAFWIRRARHGPYPRWYLARTLADLALEILRGRGANAERGGQLQGPGWEPPGEIQPYLETAVRTTPATFGRQLDSAQVHADPEAESVVEYLESYMENSNDH
ncbi:MAG: hypothetical protein HY781_07335 [Chloroflexi bacterium]|nr:hypothetical protein [Chloroflexota bacterium]